MTNENILQVLRSGRILLSDGAMGTELQKRGMPRGECPEAFNISHPDTIRAIHRDYYEAGSDIVETNTFGGTRSRLATHDLQDQVFVYSRDAAELARSVCPPGNYVAGSIGPSGEILAPFGTTTEQEAYDIFAEQAEALAEGGVDVFFVETMMALEESEVAIKAAKEKTGLPVVATMTFEVGRAGVRTQWGVDVPSMVERLSSAGADVLGSNCGRGFDEMIEVVEEMRGLTSLPIIAQANAGMPVWKDEAAIYEETPEAVAPKAERLLNLGINILGGCCGTGPAHIRQMRPLVDAKNAA